jgi:hypothetical protein
MGITELSRTFGMTPSAMGYAVRRGEKMAKERDCELER